MPERGLSLQLLVFALVGLAATATHYSIALLVHDLLFINVYLASLAGYCSAIVISFMGHGYLTFQVKPERRYFKRFLLVSVGVFLISEAILAGFEGSAFPPAGALAVAVLVIPLLSFVLNKLWVYRKPRDQDFSE